MFRILIIEDDPIQRQILLRSLAPEGYECLAAGTAAEGLRLCGASKPDAVVMDVHLPDGNGIALCGRLKGDPALRHIPVLLITGEAAAVEHRVEGLESGADDYILKPFSPRELVSRLRRLLRAGTRPTSG